MIVGLLDSGALPVLERVVQFTQQRHGVITDNVANLSTPYFKPRELDTGAFQAALRDAVDQRRDSADPTFGPLELRDTDQLRFHHGRIETTPGQSNQGVLFHDQNNRDLERVMQDLAENTLAHNMGIEMLRSEFSLLSIAIRERV